MMKLLLVLSWLLPAPASAQGLPKLAPEERAKLEAARTVLRADAALHPDVAEGWLKLGRIEQSLGDAEAARDAFQQAVRLTPENAGAWSLLAVAHEKLKETDKAVKAWQVCLVRTKDAALAAVARKHIKVLGTP